MHHLWFHYVWPSLQGNGPEDIIATVGVAIVSVLLWPPTRKRIHRFIDTKLAPIHSHHDTHHDELAEIRRRVDHLLRHTGADSTLPPP